MNERMDERYGLDTPQEREREVMGLRKKYQALEKERDQLKRSERVLKYAVEQLLCERDGDSGNIDDTLLEAEMEIRSQELIASRTTPAKEKA